MPPPARAAVTATLVALLLLLLSPTLAQQQPAGAEPTGKSRDEATFKAEHGIIGRASVAATAKGNARSLFAIPQFKDGGSFDEDLLPPQDLTLALEGVAAEPASVMLLGDGSALEFEFANDGDDGAVRVKLPASKRTELVDVVQIQLAATGTEPARAADPAAEPRR